eukprot:scaffold127154_cov75-Phaeocystis_antarctica.AAC.1
MHSVTRTSSADDVRAWKSVLTFYRREDNTQSCGHDCAVDLAVYRTCLTTFSSTVRRRRPGRQGSLPSRSPRAAGPRARHGRHWPRAARSPG